MNEGQEVWLLQEQNNYRKEISDCIKKCIYKGQSSLQGYEDRFCSVQLINNGNLLSSPSSLGMTMVANNTFVFETLKELKEYIINNKRNEINNLLKQANNLNEEILYVQSLKDIKQDREDKLINLLSS